jgi:hypothetical protein
MASKRRQRRRLAAWTATPAAACHGKRGFATQEQAQRVVALMAPIYRQEGDSGLLAAYRCTHCLGEVWHVGHRPRALQRLLAG